MNAKTRDLALLLPHRPPSVLLDEVLDYGNEHASARLRVHAQSNYFDRQQRGVPAWVGVEYMAQTLAIWAGDQRLQRGRPVNIALLVAVRQYRSNVPVFAEGVELTINATLILSEDTAAVFDCEIVGQGVFVSARLSAVSPEN